MLCSISKMNRLRLSVICVLHCVAPHFFFSFFVETQISCLIKVISFGGKMTYSFFSFSLSFRSNRRISVSWENTIWWNNKDHIKSIFVVEWPILNHWKGFSANPIEKKEENIYKKATAQYPNVNSNTQRSYYCKPTVTASASLHFSFQPALRAGWLWINYHGFNMFQKQTKH